MSSLGVGTKVLNQAVKRNMNRFPEDFVFQLTENEFKSLRSQIVTSKRGGRKYRPYAFTEHGAVMLASVLRSKQAVQISIEVVKAFVKLRQTLASTKNIAKQLLEVRNFMLKRANATDREFKKVWRAIEDLTNPIKDEMVRTIGFKVDK